MWSSGYQVILSYDKIEQLIKHIELWPAIPYWWGNKDTAQKLIEFLAKRKQSGRPGICPFCIYGVYLESIPEFPSMSIPTYIHQNSTTSFCDDATETTKAKQSSVMRICCTVALVI